MPRLLALAMLVAFTPGALAQPAAEPPTAPAPADVGAGVYRNVLRSTVWVHSDRGSGRLATGTGTLVDRGRRLVLTNYHVVGDVKRATVFFPDSGRDKRAISDRKHYLENANRLGIAGDVVEIDKEGDLALVRIDRVPDGVPALALANESPDPGQTVHSVGNPGKSGALWVYTPGKVRQVYSKKWRAKLDDRTVLTFEARVIETDSPTNPGDSGGPLVNDKGQLVGVTQGGAIDAQLLSTFVDLSEVKRLLNRRSVQTLRSTEAVAADSQVKEKGKEKEPAKPHRDAALKSKDEAKFFSEEAFAKVQPAADKLLKEKGLDLLIETFDTLPNQDAAKLKAMSAADRTKVLKEFAEGRLKSEKMVGLYIVVNKNPGSLYVVLAEAASKKLSDEVATRVKQTLLKNFGEKKFDAGLADALKILLDSQGLGEKKDEKKEDKK
jgi:hypothetical protein